MSGKEIMSWNTAGEHLHDGVPDCESDHTRIADGILAELMGNEESFSSSNCGECGSSIIVSSRGVDGWEIRIYPPRPGIEHKG